MYYTFIDVPQTLQCRRATEQNFSMHGENDFCWPSVVPPSDAHNGPKGREHLKRNVIKERKISQKKEKSQTLKSSHSQIGTLRQMLMNLEVVCFFSCANPLKMVKLVYRYG